MSWHFDTKTDSTQDKRILRQCRSAQRCRELFPRGTRVRARNIRWVCDGTVLRHVPSNNAQGGYLVVRWDTGSVGRHGPISLEAVPSEEGLTTDD